MPSPERALSVWCFDRNAGELLDAQPQMTFAYDPVWVAGNLPPLSQSLPLDGSFGADASAAFFGGLLPEGVPREQLARRLGVSERNDFSLLAAVAGDTAGAINLQPLGQSPRDHADYDVEWLDDAELIEVIRTLPARPMHADEDGEYRLSLAGAQDKLPVVVGDDGRVGLTRGQTPSTHILKTPSDRLDDTVLNEALCPALGNMLGIDAVRATPRKVGDHEFLLIERYDRRRQDVCTLRLHQEDFCQALGIPTERKYQSEGGPSLADCFGLLRRAADVPAREILRLLDTVALSFLVGNHDAHGKNFSLLYLPDGPGAVLAPAYDILSTVAYHKTHNLTRKMAMKIGGQYKPDYLEPRHLDRMLDEAGLGAAAARRRLRGHADAAGRAARAARADLVSTGWDAPVLGHIIEIVDRRAARLAAFAAPASPRHSPLEAARVNEQVTSGRADAEPELSPPKPLNRAGHVARGQRWKDATNPGEPPRTITVDRVSPDGTVYGSVQTPSVESSTSERWPASSFASFVLVHDPHWPTYIVAAELSVDDPRAVRLTRAAGELEGSRSHTMATRGLGGPESSWSIIAPTEADALALVMQIVGPDVPVRAALRWRDEP